MLSSARAKPTTSHQPTSIDADLDRLNELVRPSPELAVSLTPPLPRLPEHEVVKSASKGTQVDRTLDAEVTKAVLAQADMVAAYITRWRQKMVRSACGSSVPLFDQNLSVAKMVNERAERTNKAPLMQPFPPRRHGHEAD